MISSPSKLSFTPLLYARIWKLWGVMLRGSGKNFTFSIKETGNLCPLFYFFKADIFLVTIAVIEWTGRKSAEKESWCPNGVTCSSWVKVFSGFTEISIKTKRTNLILIVVALKFGGNYNGITTKKKQTWKTHVKTGLMLPTAKKWPPEARREAWKKSALSAFSGSMADALIFFISGLKTVRQYMSIVLSHPGFDILLPPP